MLMWSAAGHVVWVWDNCHSSDPQVIREQHCLGAGGGHQDVLSLLASSSGAFVFCGSIAGFTVLDAQTGETLHVGYVNEGITDVVEVGGWGLGWGEGARVVTARAAVLAQKKRQEVWCVHGNSVLGCWDAATFSSGQCKHVGDALVSGLVSLPNGEVWSGGSDGRICVWNVKNKRVIRSLGIGGEPVSSMVSVANELLGVLTVWVAHFDGSVSVWVASDLSSERMESAQHVRLEWRVRHESLEQIRSLSDAGAEPLRGAAPGSCVVA